MDPRGRAKSFEKSEGKARGVRVRGGKGGGEEKPGGNLSGRNPSLCPSTIRILLQSDYDLLETSLTAEAGLVKDEREATRKIQKRNCELRGALKWKR